MAYSNVFSILKGNQLHETGRVERLVDFTDVNK